MKWNLSGPGSYHILEELEKECVLFYLQFSYYNEGEYPWHTKDINR